LPIRSSEATQRRSGWSLATARGSAGARVSVPARKLREGEGIEILGLIHGGGSDFIDDGGWRPSSRASRRRRRIGCLQELHRAASQLEVEDDRRGKLGWTAGLGAGPAWASAWWAAARFLPPIYFFLFPFSIFYFYSGLNILSSI
jgi:hypothetical protein